MSESLLLLIRWLHNLAAVTWVGGGLFYALALRPFLRARPDAAPFLQELGGHFRSLVDLCVLVLVATGVILVVDRLSAGVTGTAYLLVLVVKVLAALWLFWVALGPRRRGLPRGFRMYNTPSQPASAGPAPRPLRRISSVFTGASGVAIVGVAIFFLADLLRWLVEEGLRG